MSEHNRNALEVSGLSYRYRGNWLQDSGLILNDVSFSVREGESFGFLGHNGAGKTTTIKAILGLTRPTTGSITLFGRDNRDPDVRKLIGYVPEQPYFYDHLTVRETVTLFAHLAGVPQDQVSSSVTTALDAVHLLPRGKSPLRSLSKGLTQRVAMAQAIVGDPKLLILDEPFSGLDPLGRKEFKDLFFELRQREKTLVISSHILEDIEFLCSRASIMVRGEIRALLDLSQLHDNVDRCYEITVEQSSGDEAFRRLCEQRFGGVGESTFRCSTQGSSCRYEFSERSHAEEALALALQEQISISLYRASHGSLEDLFVKLVQEKAS
ncbi:ABC transporter ATP-binding protein [bacterium]|nr:ABC transporter ATP-binding protein [bacterium]